MVCENQPKCPDRRIGFGHQFPLLAEEFLIEDIFIKGVGRTLSFPPDLLEGRNHVLEGLRIGRSESGSKPLLEESRSTFLLDDDLPILPQDFVLERNVTGKERPVEILRNRFVQGVNKAIEFLQQAGSETRDSAADPSAHFEKAAVYP